MGCFLGCFGVSTKRKRRKPANRILPGDKRHGSYEPLDSSVSIILDIKENPISSDPELSNKLKERSSIKIRKKVSFNLNVQTYEPLSKDETSYSDEEVEREKNGADAAKGSVYAVSGSDSSVSKMGSFPSNYRYQNCIDSYHDEDDMADIESDLDYDDEDEDDDEEDDSGNEFDDEISRKEFLEKLNPKSVAEDKFNNHMQLTASTDGGLKPVESIRNARDRSQYVSSVLNPVQNLTQWKAIKARTAPTKHLRKENIALQHESSVPSSLKPSSNLYPSSSNLESKYNQSKPLLQEIAVDTSLSNWLASPNSNKSKATSITNGRSSSIENISSKNNMFDRSCSQQSRELRPISDIITNLEA